MSYNFGLLEKLKWPSQIESNLSRIGMMEHFINKPNTTHLVVFQRLNDIFHQDTFAEIRKDSSKLRTYSLIKTKIGMEGYIAAHPQINTQDRIALTKFRLSNHDLMIEKGRHFKVAKAKRFCPFCPKTIETELHFLVQCSATPSHAQRTFLKYKEEIEHLAQRTFLKYKEEIEHLSPPTCASKIYISP